MEVWAIVVAAGSGSRFGGAKQFELLGDRRVLDWAVAAARSVADGVVVVVPPGTDDGAVAVHGPVPGAESVVPGADSVVPGAATRAGSVRSGLGAVPLSAEVIVVHDAARPLASASLFAAVVKAVAEGADGAVPGLPLADTVKRVSAGVVAATLERSELVAVQTPQAFRAAALREAHGPGAEATDDAALVEAGGGRVVVVPGEVANAKVTTPEDLERARSLVKRGLVERGAGGAPAARRAGG